MNRFTSHIAAGAVAALLALGTAGLAHGSEAHPAGSPAATILSGQPGTIEAAPASVSIQPLTNDWG